MNNSHELLQNEIKQQKEKLYNERQVLQRQVDILRQSGQLPQDTSLSGLSMDSTDKVQSKSDFVPGHKRSASAESFNSSTGETSKKSGLGGTSKENNFRSEHKPSSKQSFSFAGNKQNIPVHLISATNEQKVGSKNVQQLPSKLLAGGNSVSSLPQQTSQTGMKSSSAGNKSSPSLAQDSGGDGNMGHSASTGQLGGQSANQNQYGSSVTVPMGSYQSNRPKSSAKSGISGVLKLAEKSDKKSKSGSSSHGSEKGAQSSSSENPASQQRPKSGTAAGRNPNVHHKPQKSDSDVIYF